MNIEWNKVTWYSKLLAVVLFVLTFYVGFSLGVMSQKQKIEMSVKTPTPAEKAGVDTHTISIKSQTIKEENFTGKMSVVTGGGTLAVDAEAYINKTISDFRKQANTDVPDLIKHFGAGSPPASYEIDVGATYLKSEKTESIIITTYTYTGGAHGSTTYKVFTTSLSKGKVLALSGVIASNEQSAFTEFVKKQLLNWKVAGSDGSPVFSEEVQALKFSSFTNWSLDDKNLTIYFDQYDIGPGALGEVAFPLSRSTISNFLDLNNI